MKLCIYIYEYFIYDFIPILNYFVALQTKKRTYVEKSKSLCTKDFDFFCSSLSITPYNVRISMKWAVLILNSAQRQNSCLEERFYVWQNL